MPKGGAGGVLEHGLPGSEWQPSHLLDVLSGARLGAFDCWEAQSLICKMGVTISTLLGNI